MPDWRACAWLRANELPVTDGGPAPPRRAEHDRALDSALDALSPGEIKSSWKGPYPRTDFIDCNHFENTPLKAGIAILKRWWEHHPPHQTLYSPSQGPAIRVRWAAPLPNPPSIIPIPPSPLTTATTLTSSRPSHDTRIAQGCPPNGPPRRGEGDVGADIRARAVTRRPVA